MEKTYEAVINGEKYSFRSGTTPLMMYRTLPAEARRRPMAAVVDGKLMELMWVVEEAHEVKFLYPNEDEEASRIFLRGLLFLLMRAVKECFGEETLKTEYILNGGIYCTLENRPPLTVTQVKLLEEKMKAYVHEGLPFLHEKVSTEEATEYFASVNETDKVRLLSFRPYDFFHLYQYDGLKNYFYGFMPPDASYLDGFSLKKFDKGLIMCYPAPYWVTDRSYEDQPKFAKVFSDAERWGNILEVSQVSDLNDLVRNRGLREFIMVNEALHEKKLSELANSICEKEKARVVLIAGPSSSGKTTFANRLKIHLRVHGKRCFPISTDDFYMDRDKIPLDEHGKPDIENITALDIPRFNDVILSLLSGKETLLPKFDFIHSKSGDGKVLKIDDDDILIIEGIHGLNERLSRDIPAEYKYKIFISPLCPLNLDNQNTVFPEDIRLLRRLIRDKLTRGYGFMDTLNTWESVRMGEYKYILPYMENADTIFNSALLYEAAILKKYAFKELNELKMKSIRASYLVKFLNYFESCEDDMEIPRNSILREFIGDSCFF